MIGLQRPALRNVYLGAVAIVVAAFAWRPFFLGYYGDDWFLWYDVAARTANFSFARWEALDIASNRPVLRVVLFLLGSLIPGTAVAVWQVVACMLTLITGIFIGWFLLEFLRLFGRNESQAKTAAVVGTLFWLVFPWGAPNAFWPTGSTAFLAEIFFVWAGVLLLQNWPHSNLKIHFGALLTALSYLTYEAFYLQIFPLIGFLTLRRGWNGPKSWAICASYGAAQLAAFAYNRMMRASGAEGSRAVNSNFVETYLHWLISAGNKLDISKFAIIAVYLAASAVFGLAVTILATRRAGSSIDTRRLVAGVGLTVLLALSVQQLVVLPYSFLYFIPVVGIALLTWGGLVVRPLAEMPSDSWQFGFFSGTQLFLGGLTFALGNYVMFSMGIGGRTTLAINLWLAAIFAFLALQITNLPPTRRKWAWGAATITILAFLAATGSRGTEWAASWQKQKEIVANPAAMDFAKLGPDPAFVFIGPEVPGWVPVFENNWIMGSATVRAYLAMASDQGFANRVLDKAGWTERWLVARNSNWVISWDGERLSQLPCNTPENPISSLEPSEIWIWEYGNPSMFPARKPFTIGCGKRSGV